jgi:HlyD family secretion protein
MPIRRNQSRRRSAFPTSAIGPVAALVLVAGCGHKAPEHADKEAAAASKVDKQALRIERRDIHMKVEQPGTIQAFESTPVFARIGGYVDKYRVNIGDRVKTDDVLLAMWIPDLVEALNQKKAATDRARVQIRVAESAVRSARATLENTRARIVSAEAGVKRSQAAYTRWESESSRLNQLVANQVLNTQVRDETYRQFEEAAAARDQAVAMVNESVASRDKAQADLERAGVDVEAARADLSVAQAEQRQAQVIVDYGAVKAPYDGVITQRNVSPGDYLQPGGGSGGRPLFVLEQTDPVRVFVGVPELAASFINDEDTALIRIQAIPGAFRRGKIVRSGFSLNPSSRTLQAEIDVPNADGHLRPGMYATVTITIDRKQVFAVPSSSVVFLGGQSYALDLLVDGKAARTPVLIGPSDDRFTEILRKKSRAEGGEDWIAPDGGELLVGPEGTGGPSSASAR